jgi:hypothetical protein
MSQRHKYIAGFYTGTNFCVCLKTNHYNLAICESNHFNYELRCRLTAIKKNNKRINPEYSIIRKITNQLSLI